MVPARNGEAMSPTRVTLSDVAAASGVSRSTVSFVLNDAPNQTISAETQARVRQAAAELGYVPHGIARALREGASRLVVLQVDAGMDGTYARTFIGGLDDELGRRGHVLLVRHGRPSAADEQQVLDAIAPRAVLRLAERYLIGHELDDGGWESGMAANVALQVGHLAERGHARLAMALPDEGAALAEVRLRFAQEAARRSGLPPLQVVSVPQSRTAGLAAVTSFLADHADVTAVAAFSDDVALRVLAALRDGGLDVPGDVAVIGFDDTEFGALLTPALTTVHIDARTHGRVAARAALGLDATDLAPRPGRVVVRRST